MDIRRRVVPQAIPQTGFLQKLKDFDAYAKPLEDFRIKTVTGASVTIVSGLIILILLFSEFTDWIHVDLLPSLQVDKSRKEQMQINMNMSFPHIPCFMLSIDVMDVSGAHQNGVDHLMHKSRIDVNGNLIEKTQKSLGDDNKIRDDARNKTSQPGYCGSCYGATKPASGCCNTCEDVRRAYQSAGWSLEHPDDFEQCAHEGFTKLITEQSNEGCNIDGYVRVNKVQGNFHFSPGPSFELQGMHAHDLNDYRKHKKDWRFSHIIHHLSFGESTGFTNPLDNVKKEAKKMYDTYQYFIKVVSTEFTFLNRTRLITNQFAATEHEQDLSSPFGDMPTSMPGVFFIYDISPMLIKYDEYRKPFTHFLTDLCAIVGGVFTVAGLLDGFLYSAEKKLSRKDEIGKQY